MISQEVNYYRRSRYFVVVDVVFVDGRINEAPGTWLVLLLQVRIRFSAGAQLWRKRHKIGCDL